MTATKKDIDNRPVRVRFAPSPTGLTHIGSARTALYNVLLARQTGGKFIWRLEDTDQKRYDPNAEEDLKQSLRWLGFDWDEGPDIGGSFEPYRQSERKEIYREYAEILIKKGHAFYCFCTREELAEMRKQQQKRKEQPRYAGPCGDYTPSEAEKRVSDGDEHVIRFKMPKEGSITVDDRLRGEITFENKNLDDYILVKSDGLALYHLAAMVDDHLMEITHVFRGEEWLPTFPLHVHIYRAFGWQEPEWVHVSLFLKPSGKGKMSKRDTEEMKLTGKTIFIQDLKELGYLPEAVINWIALMGWSYDDHTEFFTMDDLIEKFDIERLNPSNAAINFKKLDHFNGLHIRNLSVDELSKRLLPYFKSAGHDISLEDLSDLTPLIQERMTTLDEGPQLAGFLFQEQIELDPQALVAKKLTAQESLDAAQAALKVLEALPEITHNTAETPLRALAEEMDIKVGQLFGILRIAVTGQRVSPPLLESMQIVGKAKVLERVSQAIQVLAELAEEEN